MSVPLGFRFSPSDEELISSYLLKRVRGLPLPCHVILEKDLYGQNTAPCDVFGEIDESNSWYWQSDQNHGATKKTIYAFTKLVKAGSNSCRIGRRAGSGTWSGQTGARKIKNFNGEIIGSRKMLTFEDSTAKKGGYHWIMHEYSLDGVYKNLCPNNINNDVVLCKITRSSKGKPTTNIENNGAVDQISQLVASTIQNNDSLDQIPRPVESTTRTNRDGYSSPSACISGGSVDHIPQSSVAIENKGDGYSFPGACIDGGCVDQIPQWAAAIENNGDVYSFLSACINGGGVEDNGDGFYSFSERLNEGVLDQLLQSVAAIENNVEASPWSLSGHKRSRDEGTGVLLLEDCEGQTNPKKSRNCDDLSRGQSLAEYSEIDIDIDIEELRAGLRDIESFERLADDQIDVV